MQTTRTVRAPTPATSRPENGIAISDPTAMNSSAKPRPRSSACRSSRTAGMRDAQVANSIPLDANTTRTAHACRRTEGGAAAVVLTGGA